MICTKKQARLVSRRFLLLLFFTFLLAATANAYTLIMRNGRRVEIPSNFTVAPLTLTYEVSAGIQITVQLVAIDIPATERANNEPAGSLLRHSEKQVNLSDDKGENVQTTSGTSKRSITNSDLAAFRRARLESEVTYERRRRELGLPSIEESRRRAALDAEEGFERLRQRRSEELDSEDYWRSRAARLRTEIAANNARIGFVRARLDELPGTNSVGAFTSISPYDTTGRPIFGGSPQVFGNPRVFGTPTIRPQVTPRVGSGGDRDRGQVLGSPNYRGTGRYGGRSQYPYGGGSQYPYPYGGRSQYPYGGGSQYPYPYGGASQYPYGGGSQYPFPNASVWDSPFQSYDSSFERPTLITELDQLLGYRAELEARWRELENEARRAGAAPGWLRP